MTSRHAPTSESARSSLVAEWINAVTPLVSIPTVGDAFFEVSTPASLPSGVAPVDAPILINSLAE